MTMELDVTGGVATWVDALRYDAASGRVTFRTVLPNAPATTLRRVTFADARDYAEELFDATISRDRAVLECLVGLDAHPRGPATWYVIHTSEREVTFYTDTPPRVEALPAAGHGESGSPAA